MRHFCCARVVVGSRWFVSRRREHSCCWFHPKKASPNRVNYAYTLAYERERNSEQHESSFAENSFKKHLEPLGKQKVYRVRSERAQRVARRPVQETSSVCSDRRRHQLTSSPACDQSFR